MIGDARKSIVNVNVNLSSLDLRYGSSSLLSKEQKHSEKSGIPEAGDEESTENQSDNYSRSARTVPTGEVVESVVPSS